MKVLTLLKHLINFLFFAFLGSACLLYIGPFVSPSFADYNSREIFWLLTVFPLVHLIIIFMILFFLRKFVLHATVGTPLDASSRKYLKLSGIFCLIYGLLRVPQFFALITFYRVVGFDDVNSISQLTGFFVDLGSLFYSLLIGLFFIYLSKVLESSYLIKQENQLTI